ncbi:hypothetical protein NDU88_005641 [Pleurodeles waltl]|uniref:Uncharacterized protein n=1 Tax=Pleurodeles waltl TaxID=8319 RepID=A0AAV7TW11_PLEWA|nr:hypothetical protein NDU88_005641 [Pleurodeles waltl]
METTDKQEVLEGQEIIGAEEEGEYEEDNSTGSPLYVASWDYNSDTGVSDEEGQPSIPVQGSPDSRAGDIHGPKDKDNSTG